MELCDEATSAAAPGVASAIGAGREEINDEELKQTRRIQDLEAEVEVAHTVIVQVRRAVVPYARNDRHARAKVVSFAPSTHLSRKRS